MVMSLPVDALLLPPAFSISLSNCLGPYFFAPLNIMCSKKCEIPGDPRPLIARADLVEKIHGDVGDSVIFLDQNFHAIGQRRGLDVLSLSGCQRARQQSGDD